jgi:hypothetical protein
MQAGQYELDSYEDAIEMFHRKGWTDGLPIVPPTPARVADFLTAANLTPDAQIGYYRERTRPIIAEKLAINAVMAGCLPEYFPVVIALVEAILAPELLLHAANSSTSSFAYGFIVNGPIRKTLGMNCHGNVLGPGNRANASIGRAVRLIQLNVMGSIPGAGAPTPAHGRPVLDRSTIGQPAKYTGYHIVENEDAFPSLAPVHVEMGYEPTDSTVTVFNVAGHLWLDNHGDKTPESWIASAAQYIVGAGRLVGPKGHAVMMLPLEDAQLFVNAGWTKADIRQALYDSTRRSVAWIKANGYRVGLQRERGEAVLAGDDDTYMAVSGSASPHDLHIVVCGGPAGSFPFYVYPSGGSQRPVTRKIAC